MQFIGIAHIRPSFFAYLGNRGRIEPPDFLEHRLRQHASHLHRTRPPLLKRRVIQIGVRIRIQNLMRKLRRNRCIDCDAANAPVRHPPSSDFNPSMSIASVSTSFITSLTRGWSGILRHLECFRSTPQRRETPRTADHQIACAESAAELSFHSENATTRAPGRHPSASAWRK